MTATSAAPISSISSRAATAVPSMDSRVSSRVNIVVSSTDRTLIDPGLHLAALFFGRPVDEAAVDVVARRHDRRDHVVANLRRQLLRPFEAVDVRARRRAVAVAAALGVADVAVLLEYGC